MAGVNAGPSEKLAVTNEKDSEDIWHYIPKAKCAKKKSNNIYGNRIVDNSPV